MQVRNRGRVLAKVQARVLDDAAAAAGVLAVEPDAFTLPPQGFVSMCLTLTGTRLGALQRGLRFLARQSPAPAASELTLQHVEHCFCV